MSDTPRTTDSTLRIDGYLSNPSAIITSLIIEKKRLERENAELRKDKERLDTLIRMTDMDGEQGWCVKLAWENVQDIACVVDSNGNTVGQCTLDYPDDQEEATEQDFNKAFRAAIDAAKEVE